MTEFQLIQTTESSSVNMNEESDKMSIELPNITRQQRTIFNPPLCTQRYVRTQQFIASNPNIKSVTDFGCGNGRIFLWLKKVPHLEKISFVDVDDYLLENTLHGYFEPGLWEMLFGRQCSKVPLDIKVYHGDLNVPDERLCSDCITMIELIEHMHPVDVERATRTIFGYYQPHYVYVSTPNSEFNHMLRENGESPTTFRHEDHKFEWTRAQFTQWCQEVCLKFPYTFYLDGVGHLPGSEPYGPCTQIAIFQRSTDQRRIDLQGQLDCFDLLLDKLNVKENIPERRIDRQRKKISLMAEYKLPGCVGELPNNEPIDMWERD